MVFPYALLTNALFDLLNTHCSANKSISYGEKKTHHTGFGLFIQTLLIFLNQSGNHE